MRVETHLHIGGPMDGRRIVGPPGNLHKVRVPQQDGYGNDAFYDYIKQNLKAGQNELFVWVLASMRIEEALARLVQYYAPDIER